MKQSVVEVVKARAAGYCEKCGGREEASMALHHRKLKSRGGKDEVANLLWLHHGCHNLRTGSVHHEPELATEMGWMVPSYADPAEWSLVTPDGTKVRLQNDGSVKAQEEE